MRRRKVTWGLLAGLIGFGGAVGLQAQTVTFSWKGAGSSNDWYLAGNWISSDSLNPAPPGASSGLLNSIMIFGNAPNTYVRASSSLYANQLIFTGSRPYFIDGE